MLKNVVGIFTNLRSPPNHPICEHDDYRGNYNQQNEIPYPPKHHVMNVATAIYAMQVANLGQFSRLIKAISELSNRRYEVVGIRLLKD